VGLGGEIRPSAAVERRVAEAARLGFRRVFGSARNTIKVPGMQLVPLEHIGQLVRALAA
jgi:DNA repair protein RadA/Sms